MSAIIALYNISGQPVDRTILDRMVESLGHRGPDRSGVWSEESIGLGHCMLSTTPESLRDMLPLASRSGDLVLTADARIDNRDELLSSLSFDGCPDAEITDSQLILAAYEKWEEFCTEKLLGDFAFAIWDRRRQAVFCARDQIGVKPLYYYLSDRAFVLASEIKALFCSPDVPHQLNNVRMADHLLNAFEEKVSTFYKDIFRLPPAHSLTVSPGLSRLRHYWSLDPSREIRLRSDEEYAEAFRDIFTKAVRCRLRSAYPVGSNLSGGLDSSSIACTARRVLAEEGGRRLHTFSAIFPGLPKEDMPKIDERRYIDAVLALDGFEPHFVRADCLGPLADLDRVLWHEDEAFLAPNLYMHWALFEAARRAGVRVLLDGIDGDTTVSHGMAYLAELTRKGRWITLYSEASALSRRSPNPSFTPRRILWQYGFRDAIPEWSVRAWRVLRRRPQPVWDENKAINPSFAERVGLSERAKHLMEDRSRRRQTVREQHYDGLNSAQIPYTLELADKASAAFGIEMRYPFFDRRLMEFCLAVPAEQKLNQGWTRIIMRRAMAGVLPQEVQWRVGKSNLSPNFKRRLLDYGRPIINDIIEKEPQVIEKYFDVAALRAVLRRYASQPSRSDQDALTIYGAVVLGSWLRNSGLSQ